MSFQELKASFPRFCVYFPGKPVRVGCSPARTKAEGISLHLWGSCFITLLIVSFLVLEVQGCVSEVLFPHWEALFAVGEEGQELSF